MRGKLAFLVGLLSATLGGVTATSQRNTPGSEWENYNNRLDAQRYSVLKQITAGNVDQLAEVCHVQVADRGAFESGLLKVDDSLFATTVTETFALDPSSCSVRWKHTHVNSEAGSLPVNRGLAYLNGRVFRGTDDAHVIALDARTGQELWRSVIGDSRLGEYISSAPAAWNGLVYVGIAASELGIRGRIVAFDAATGREVWRFNTIPMGKEKGATTWSNGAWALHGGGGTWSTFTLDPDSAEIFIPVGNPVPDFSPADRPGRNLFTDSVVVLDARSGALRWWYQLRGAGGDSHDYDLGAAPMLYRDADNRQMVAAGGKDGYVHLIDRSTHKLVFKIPVTTVDALPQVPSPEGVRVCPGIVGGIEWNGPSFDPIRKLIYVGAVDFCSIFRSAPGSTWAPGPNLGGSWMPGDNKASGWVKAIDPNAGKIVWEYHADGPVLAGVTPTAGGLVMTGDNAGNFLVFNSTTGGLLKKYPTGGALAGGVITYTVHGKQYIAFASGNASRSVFGAVGRPSIVVMSLPGALTSPSRPNAPDADNGREMYESSCIICHGADGAAIAGFNLRGIGKKMTELQLIEFMKDPTPPMPKLFPLPLSKDDELDIADVASYLAKWQ